MFGFLFGDRAGAISSLFLGSFRLLGEENVRELLFRRLYFSLIVHALAILGVAMICLHYHRGWGISLLVILGIVIYPYSFFYHIRARARQTWFAYAKISNHADPVGEAAQMVSKQKWTLRLFALVELVLGNASTAADGERQGGMMQFLVAAALDALQGLYSVAEDYLLPAIVIERLSLPNAAHKLRQLKDNIPATLAGSFGLNIFTGALSSVLFAFYFILIGLGIMLSWGLPKLNMIAPENTLTFHSQTGQEIHIFVLPTLAAIILMSLLHRLLKILMTSIQATYFAIFYTRVNRPDEIAPELRPEVDGYLATPMKDVTPPTAAS